MGLNASNLPHHWHWLHPRESTIDASIGEVIAGELRATFQSAAELYAPEHVQNRTRLRRQRRLDSDKLWRQYQQHAHRASLPLSARLYVADALSANIALISANRESHVEHKLLRFATGRRIAAIASDCETFLSSNPSDALAPSAALRLAHLFVQALALQCQPKQALHLLDKTLKHLWPQLSPTSILEQRSDLNISDLDAIAQSLSTILDSISAEIKCRTTAEDISSAVDLHPNFYIDPIALKDVLAKKALPSESPDPAQLCLNSFLDFSYFFLFDQKRLARSRARLMRVLASIGDISEKLSVAVGARSWKEPNVYLVSSLCIRAHMLHGSKDAALDAVDLLWNHDILLSDSLVNRMIRTCSDAATASRIETIIKRALIPKDRISTKSILARMSSLLVKGITLFWAGRGRPDYAQRFLSEALRRNEPKGQEFQQLVNIEIAAARGNTNALKKLLSNRFDLDAVEKTEVLPGKQRLNTRVLFLLLKCYTRVDDLEAAEDLFSKALDMRIPLRTSYFNFLIDMHVRRTNIDEAISIFEQMKNFDVVPDKATYSLIVHGFGIRRDPEGAAHTVRAMVAANVRPDRITYSTLLNCYVNSGMSAAAVKLFQWMQHHPEVSYRPTIEVCNTILKAFVADSLPVQDVLKFVALLRERGLEPNSRTFALMIQSACDANLLNIAEELFTEAERQLPPPPNCPPGQGADRYHFTILIHGYLRRGDHAVAKSYFDEMRDRGIQPSDVTWSVMVSNYAQSDNEINYDLACTLVTQLIEDDTFKAYGRSRWRAPVIRPGLPFEKIFAPLLVAQARRGEPAEAERTMSSLMQTKSGISLHSVTPLLDAYRKAGQVDKGLELFNRMYADALAISQTKTHRLYGYANSVTAGSRSHAGKHPQTEEGRRQDITSRNILCLPISIVIDMLSKAHRHADIAKIWSRAQADGFGFDSDNWNHLAASMARAGQWDEALSVVEQVLFLPPPSRRSFEALREKKRQQEESSYRKETDIENQAPQHPYMFDPYTMSLDADLGKSHLGNWIRSPSSPPSRRHQSRLDDDPYAPLPFDFRPRRQASGEGVMPSEDDAEGREYDLLQPSAYHINSSAGDSLTRPLTQSLNRLSPWYAHFATMEAISRGLAQIEKRSQIVRLTNKYPKAAKLLETHKAKVVHIESQSQGRAEQDAREIIQGLRPDA